MKKIKTSILYKIYFAYIWIMVKVAVELSEKVHSRVLDIQVQRRKDPDNKKPTAINKIVAEILEEAVEKETPTK